MPKTPSATTNIFARYALNAGRGVLIGAAEIVPGVSGGTVALVVGIFEDLIAAAGHVVTATRLALSARTTQAGREIREVKWAVVLPALVGMVVAVILGAKFLEPVIATYPTETRGVFGGLILASLLVPIRMVDRWGPKEILLALLAGIATAFLTGLPPTSNDSPHLVLVGLVAAVAICALVLPGVSGSFIMLSFGIYEASLAALNAGDFTYIAVFFLGAALGLSLFVKGLQYLLENQHRVTLAVMTGLMAGSLRALWPWQGESRTLESPAPNWPLVLALAAAGAAVVLFLIWVEARRETAAKTKSAAASNAPNLDQID